jgi:hypothetical protein
VTSATWRAGSLPRWKRMRQVDAREIPTTSAPNMGASRCQPMVLPGGYREMRIWAKSPGSSPASIAARSCSQARSSGRGSVGTSFQDS